MRFIFACLIILFPLCSNSNPIRTYDLKGSVSGTDQAAGFLKDISVGDSFEIQMDVQLLSGTSLNVRFGGNIGGWTFARQETSGFYYLGDFGPERFLTTGSPSFLNNPEAETGKVQALDIFISLFGLDQTGSILVPEDERLVRNDGRIDPSRFYSGHMSFEFLAMIDANQEQGLETNIFGEIDSLTRVLEPGSAIILLSGFLGLGLIHLTKRTTPQPNRYAET